VEKMTDFEPKIVAFLCNWCAYAGADLAGVSRLQYPSNIRPIRVMCSGRVDPLFIIRAFKQGCDGILVAGWHFGDCHYLEGNVQAEKKIRLTQKLLDIAGIGKDRLHLAWVSSAEAQRFAEVTTTATTVIKNLGKFEPQAFALELSAAEMTLGGEALRWLVGKEVKLTTGGDVYGRKWDTQEYEAVVDGMLEREYQKNLIYQAIKAGYTSVRDICKEVGLELKVASCLMADLEKAKMVEFKCMEDHKPVFTAL
jgi:F420-non-reducing hydrogenase iron-sulfur subunit